MNNPPPGQASALYRGSPTQLPASKVTNAMAAVRRALAAQWIGLPAADVQRHYAERLGQMHRLVHGSGLRDSPPSDDDRAFIAELKATLADTGPRNIGPGTLLAAMLFLYPHQLPHLYELDAIPQWLLADYLAYTFNNPTMFREIGEAEACCEYAIRWTGYLHDKVLANFNNEFWRNIALFFTQNAGFIPVYFNTRNLRDLYRKRAAIMEATLQALNGQVDYKFGPRPKRNRLRLGILAAHYAPKTETFATLPVYRHLDRTKFEVVLFSLQHTNLRLEQFCARHADRFVALPGDLRQGLQMVREADLDLIFIGNNTTAIANNLTMLALHRLARVQVAGVCSCVTTGMRNLDYFLSGRLSEPPDAQSHYSEKLIMVDGPAHCFNFGDEPPSSPTEVMNREVLGIAGETTVFISGANFYKILPELEETWMRILAAVPRAHLVLYPFNPHWLSTYPVDAFLERLNAAMVRHGVDSGRITVLRPAPDKADVLERLRLGDIYLDSFPFCGATSLLDPFEIGLPTVVMDGGPHRTMQGAALLRDMELDELIVKNADAYVALAAKLAGDDGFRDQIRSRVASKMKSVPRFLDSKWYGAQAGLAFERMWKQSGHDR
jgi:predicted O-linked N-acetylglucosamine transferase (SPINDLY family)